MPSLPRALTIAAAAFTLAACASTSTPAATSTPEPRTAAGARAAARKYFTLYATRQFAAEYPMLSPADRVKITEPVWVQVNQTCDTNRHVSYQVNKVALAGETATVTVVLASVVSEPVTFIYSSRQWYYSDPNFSFYRPTAAATFAALRSEGRC
jgi:hypothetical protein